MDIRDQIKTDSDYYQVYQKIREIAQTELPKIQIMFPYYTDHGIPHCDSLFELIGEIISDNVSLTPFESLLLGGAVFLHDIGMAPRDGESPTEAMQKEIRDNHHHRATEYIRENYSDWGLDEKQADKIAEISIAHRGRKAKDISEYPDEPTVGTGAKGRVRLHLLCALLRIADECHVTYDRVESLMKHENQLDEENRKHFLKHLSTEGISCSPKGEVLEISATITRNEVREILEGVQKKIEYELDGVRDIFQRYGIGIKAVRVYLQESESLQIENQGIFHDFVMKLLENGSLQISNFMKEANIGSAAFQHLLKMSKEKRITIEEGKDLVSLELASGNLIAVSRIFLDSPSKMKFIQLDTFQQAIEKRLASIIRDRFYIETDEATLGQILGFSKRLPSVLHFLLVSDNLYYANVFKYNNQFEKFNLSNLPRSRFISEILTAVLKDLQTLPPSDLKELGEYTSTIEVSMSLKDHTKFALASSTTFALMKLAAGASPIEAGQPVKATNIPTEIQFADRQAADGHFVEAKKIYEGILKKSPTCVAAINNLGLLYNGLGHHEQAIPLFDKIIHELDPELPQAYLNKGISLANLDKRNEAVENYKKAIQKNPENSKAWYQKGIVYFESGKYSSAKDCFERVLHVFPSVTHFHLSKCLVKLDDQQGAMFNVNEAIKSDSTNIDARFWKMDLLHKSGNREGALTQLSEIADICYELMTFHRTNKKTFDDAINYYFTAADLKAMTLIEMGRYEACNKFLDELLFQIPEHAMGWYNKACALAHLKRKSEMLESLRKGIDRMPSLKEKAQEDKDFQDYWRDEEFNTVVGDSDPLLSLAGTLESDITNIGEKHDFYIGQTILTKLRGEE